MVDALQACWRVLRPGGQLVDTRPIGIDRRIEVIAGGTARFVGLVDVSRGRPDDIAANEAMATAVAAGLFDLEHRRSYAFSNHWEGVAAARQHVASEWSDFANVDNATWQRATAFGPAPIVIRGPVQIDSYRRTQSGHKGRP